LKSNAPGLKQNFNKIATLLVASTFSHNSNFLQLQQVIFTVVSADDKHNVASQEKIKITVTIST